MEAFACDISFSEKYMMKNITKITLVAVLFITGTSVVSAQQALCGSVAGRSLCTITNQATNITQTSATISGSVTGGSSATQSWLELNGPGLNCPYVDPSDTSNQTATCRTWALQNGGGNLSYTATFLRCGTTYNFRTVAREGNTLVGDQPWRQFSTLSCGGGTGNDVRVISFSASPSYFSNGGGTTNLSWSSENASSCTISNIGSVAVNGTRSQYVGSTQSFTLNCVGTSGGSDSRTVTVQVNQVVNNFQINSFTASPSYLSTPGNTTLSWSTTNASTCSISGIGSVNVDGSRSQYVGSTQTFTLSCVGTNGGSDSRTITVQVDQVSNNFRIDSFTASPAYLSTPGNTNLSWSTTNASSCSLSSEGTVNTSGSRSVYVSSSRSFTLSCVGINGGSDSRTIYVQVDSVNTNPVRIDSFYASPSSVSNGGYTTLYWNTQNASSCSLNGSSVVVSGSRSAGPFYGSQNYTLVCYGVNGGSDSRTVYITTSGQTDNPVINNFNVVNVGDGYVNITWSSNADYCIAGGDWSGTKSASGSERVGPFSGTRTFTLTCYRNNQTTSQTQTIFVSGTQTQNNSAITNVATRIGTSGAQLNGIGIISNNQYSEGWFEYGRTESLGNTTNARSIGSARTVDFSDVVTGLSSNTVYYYRAVMRNSQGIFRGDIERFVTARVTTTVVPTTPRPVVPTATALTYSRPAFMEVTVNQVTLDAVREGEVEYQVNYRSLTNRTLVNTVIKVLLPEEFEYLTATRGVYSAENKTLTLNIGEFRAGEQGTIIVRARVLPSAQVGKTVVVTGYANYTVPQDAQFLAYQDEVVAYALTTIRETQFITGQTGSVAAGFFGSDLGMVFGWLLLLLILLAIIYMLRKLYLSFAEAKKA